MAIAIIGGGLSGTLTAINLLRSAYGCETIYLIEQDRYRMNRGVAYSSQLPFQPLNVPASAMSLFPEQPLDFYEWLTAQQHRYKKHLNLPVTQNDFIPRFIFGDYLKSRLQEAEMLAPKTVKLKWIFDEAMAVTKKDKAFHIQFKEHEPIVVHKAVLATGNFAPGNLPIPNQAFYKSSSYVASPWSAKGLANLQPDAPLLLIGSSLTMIDLVGSLYAEGHKGKIYVVSRHGLLPQPFDVHTKLYHGLKLPDPGTSLTVLELFHTIRQEIVKAEEQGYSWRSVLDAMRVHLPAIWQAFPLSEKKRFLRHVRPFWETHRHRMPASSATLITALQEQGRLELIAGTIVDMVEKGGTASVTIKRRKQTIVQTIKVTRVINCTGPQGDFTKVEQPLIQHMLTEGMIKPDDLRLGLVTAPDATLISASGVPVEGFYTLGPPRKATLYESTALREIRQQAKELAHKLMQDNKRCKPVYFSPSPSDEALQL
ncbi:FAD/NAD(P)-binding protein [Pontibacter burrus]|uniref:FAD-dependent oxidoreductase n=1 Tax=Pontibacter burrus TaxID=2704466 RepID=A0A6B3LXZ7_9BACT|nr:FAD/NAD(P)-binding protein [Pontibacter burrus]NEM98520.1 FAD-dependent oxidoreductase [Pontibacter burrus]